MQKVITLNPPVYLEFLKEHGGEAMGHGGVGWGALKKYISAECMTELCSID